MIEHIHISNDEETKRWDQFVERHSASTPFHLASWIRTIEDTYSFKPYLCVYKENGGDISGIFPYFSVKGLWGKPRLVSIPFSDYGGPLFVDGNDEEKVIRDLVENHSEKIGAIEIRKNIENDCHLVCHNYFRRHLLSLSDDPDDVYRKINKRTIKYSIRKATKANVQIKENSSQDGLQAFIRLNYLTRKKHGVPVQPDSFFKNLFDNMVQNGQAHILQAEYDSKIIASSFFITFKDTVYYKYSASDPAFIRSKNPNHLLTWCAIKKACLEGYRYFDFGRTSPDNVGLMRYKEMWGTEHYDCCYFYYPEINGATSMGENSRLYKTITSIWTRLPDPVTKILGPMICRYTA